MKNDYPSRFRYVLFTFLPITFFFAVVVNHNKKYAASATFTNKSKSGSECSLSPFRENPTWPIKSVYPYAEGYCKEEADVCPSIFLSLHRIWEDIKARFPSSMSRFVVNIGARDGIAADPLFPLLESHPEIGGVFIEFSETSFQKLQANYQSRFPNAQLVHDSINIFNAVTLGKGKNITSSPYPSSTSGLDVLKFDIDGCECHILEFLIADSFFANAKVIQIETNHHLPPPIMWQDMCFEGQSGRSGKSLDVWGCSVQSAYEIVKKAGFELLQYDWPDAVFIHRNYSREIFPCIMDSRAEAQTLFLRNYWIGQNHARTFFSRFPYHQSNKTFVAALPEFATTSFYDPKAALLKLVETFKDSMIKRPLWVEVGVADTGVFGNITANAKNEVFLSIHN